MPDLLKNPPWELISGWMNPSEAEVWMNVINVNVKWSQPLACVYGRNYLLPRLTSFLAHKGISYKYSGVIHEADGFPLWFLPLLEHINNATGSEFNGCLLNLYRNGLDRMGWHSDNEPELDSIHAIASLSLGEERDLLFKHRSLPFRDSLSLKNGDLLLMKPKCQKDWIHSLPSRKRVSNPRLNLTFRRYL